MCVNISGCDCVVEATFRETFQLMIMHACVQWCWWSVNVWKSPYLSQVCFLHYILCDSGRKCEIHANCTTFMRVVLYVNVWSGAAVCLFSQPDALRSSTNILPCQMLYTADKLYVPNQTPYIAVRMLFFQPKAYNQCWDESLWISCCWKLPTVVVSISGTHYFRRVLQFPHFLCL